MSRINNLDVSKLSGIIYSMGSSSGSSYEVKVGQGTSYPSIQSALNENFSKLWIVGNTNDNHIATSYPLDIYVNTNIEIRFSSLTASSLKIIGSSDELSKIIISNTLEMPYLITVNSTGFIDIQNMSMEGNVEQLGGVSSLMSSDSNVHLKNCSIRLLNFSQFNLTNSTIIDTSLNIISTNANSFNLTSCNATKLRINCNANGVSIGSFIGSNIRDLTVNGKGIINILSDVSSTQTIIDGFNMIANTDIIQLNLENDSTILNGILSQNCILNVKGNNVNIQNIIGSSQITIDNLTSYSRLNVRNVNCSNFSNILSTQSNYSIQDLTIQEKKDNWEISSTKSHFLNIIIPSGNIILQGTNNTLSTLNCVNVDIGGVNNNVKGVNCTDAIFIRGTGIQTNDMECFRFETISTSLNCLINNTRVFLPIGFIGELAILAGVRMNFNNIFIDGTLRNNLSAGVIENARITGFTTWETTQPIMVNTSTFLSGLTMNGIGASMSNCLVNGTLTLNTITSSRLMNSNIRTIDVSNAGTFLSDSVIQQTAVFRSQTPSFCESVKFFDSIVLTNLTSTTFDHCYFSVTASITNCKEINFTDCKFIRDKNRAIRGVIIALSGNCNTLKFSSCTFAIADELTGGFDTDEYYVFVSHQSGDEIKNIEYVDFNNCTFLKTTKGIVVLNIANTSYTTVQNCLFIGNFIDTPETSPSVLNLNKSTYATFTGNVFRTVGSSVNPIPNIDDNEKPFFVGNRGMNFVINSSILTNLHPSSGMNSLF